jgi:hypothetical protein
MITVYDLESFSAIDPDDSPAGEPMFGPETCLALRLQEVAPLAAEQDAHKPDFSAVIAGQLLAQL